MSNTLTKIDHSAMTVNQLVIILLNILAFIINQPWLVAVVTAAMLLGTLIGKPGFGFLYQFALKPAGIVRPHVLQDHAEPHRFAQGLGGGFMLASAIALFSNLPVLGWGLTWLVAALAALNAFGGFCVGCFLYYWFTRLGLPGFSKQPPAGMFPGMRPTGAKTNES